MFLFYDTETTDKANFAGDHTNPHQPHIVQLGALLTDPFGEVVAAIDTLIKPEGWISIAPGAQAVHGIPIESCEKYGIPIKVALSVFNNMLLCVDTAVAHNDQFDKLIIKSELHRMGKTSRFEEKKGFCTMKAMVPICKLPGGPRGQFKYPKLGEAYAHCFPERVLDGAHNATVDTTACKDIFFWLNPPDKIQPSLL